MKIAILLVSLSLVLAGGEVKERENSVDSFGDRGMVMDKDVRERDISGGLSKCKNKRISSLKINLNFFLINKQLVSVMLFNAFTSQKKE